VAIFEVTQNYLVPVAETRLSLEGITERMDLQRLLRDQIEVVAPETMVLSEEFGSFDDSRRRIDLLALDRDANVVVVELKRGADGFMDLQALRYAAMVSTLTFEQAIDAHASYLERRGLDQDASEALLDFLGWDEPNEDDFAQQVRIVLAAAEFSRELTTAVLWLNEHDLDIRCVRLQPYSLRGQILVDVQQVLPLPEATEYQVRVREKVRRERQDRHGSRDFTKYDITVGGETYRRLPKRRAVHRVVHYLCEQGVSPEDITDTIGWRSHDTLWRSVEGEHDEARFVDAARGAAAAGRPAFKVKRWFCSDDELIFHGGRTYALTKGWGLRTDEAIGSLLAAYPADIEVTEHDPER
jgi:hypothetical protein